jgi:hypothetical protein
MSYTLGQAAKAVGMSKTSILRRGMSRVLLKLAKRSLPSMILRDFEL